MRALCLTVDQVKATVGLIHHSLHTVDVTDVCGEIASGAEAAIALRTLKIFFFVWLIWRGRKRPQVVSGYTMRKNTCIASKARA